MEGHQCLQNLSLSCLPLAWTVWKGKQYCQYWWFQRVLSISNLKSLYVCSCSLWLGDEYIEGSPLTGISGGMGGVQGQNLQGGYGYFLEPQNLVTTLPGCEHRNHTLEQIKYNHIKLLISFQLDNHSLSHLNFTPAIFRSFLEAWQLGRSWYLSE